MIVFWTVFVALTAVEEGWKVSVHLYFTSCCAIVRGQFYIRRTFRSLISEKTLGVIKLLQFNEDNYS